MAHSTTSEPERYELTLGDRGRIVLPAPVRERLSLNPGDRLVLIVDESGEMRLVNLRRQVETCMGMYRHLAPRGTLASEELIAERRKEARRENKA
jgi:AbrB family looped-hinge helix DNA binding protein